MIPRHLHTIVATAALAVFILLAPSLAGAETVGLILTKGVHQFERIHEALLEHLKKEGVLGKFKFLTQRPYADPVALTNASRKLIAADVDILLAYGSSEALALVRERPRTPVLYAGVYEPIVPMLKGKRVTGVCAKYNVSSLLRYLRSSTTVKELGILYCSHEEASKAQLKELREIAEKYKMTVSVFDIKHRANIPMIMSSLNSDALIVTESPIIDSLMPTIMRTTASKKIPTASLMPDAKHTAMITLTADPEEQGKLLGEMLVKLLGGAKPQSIAPVCSRKVELVYNVKEAKRMGLRMSLDLVTEATRLISK